MVELQNDSTAAIGAVGLTINAVTDLQIAALRYFESAGDFAAMVRRQLGIALPQPLRFNAAPGTDSDPTLLLAWRSPTETWLLSTDGAAVAGLATQPAPVADGCVVDLTGGVRVVRVRGPRAGDFLRRLGAVSALSHPGEALSGRLADLNVLTVCLSYEHYLLLVERVYGAHLMDWMRATAADF